MVLEQDKVEESSTPCPTLLNHQLLLQPFPTLLNHQHLVVCPTTLSHQLHLLCSTPLNRTIPTVPPHCHPHHTPGQHLHQWLHLLKHLGHLLLQWPQHLHHLHLLPRHSCLHLHLQAG